MTKLDAEVIVVGGGPAGASTAWSLARLGVDVLVLDRANFPRDKVCSEYLSPEASRILSKMGVLDTIESRGPAHLSGMQVRSPSGTVVRGNFAGDHGFRGFRDWGLALRRTVLDEILLRAAQTAGARVEEGVKVSDVIRGADGRVSGVRGTYAGGETRSLSASIVVGADGLRSVVGRRVGLVRVRRWPRRIALVAHYRGIEGVSDFGEIHVEDGQYSGMASVGNGVANVAIVVPVSRAVEVAADKTEFFEEWFGTRPHLAPRFKRAERISDVRATGPFASTARVAWAPGAALVGDAADFYDPFTGEGIYTALRGGELLAPFVAQAIALGGVREKSALRAYERARRAEFGPKWRVERLIGMTIALPALANRAAAALARRKDMADILVGVGGDFIPPRVVLNPRFLFNLFLSSGAGA